MVLKLLVLRWDTANQSAAGHAQVIAVGVRAAIYQKEFLLSPESRIDSIDIGLAKKVQNLGGGFRQIFDTSQQASFLIQRFTIVCDEDGGNVKDSCAVRPVTDEHG